MIALNLLKGLKEEVEKRLTEMRLPTESEGLKKVSVYVQRLPLERFEVDSYYPLIVVELLGLEDNVESSKATVLLTLGTYDGESSTGYIEHLNLLEAVRRVLLTRRIVAEKFVLELPLSIGLVENTRAGFMYSNIYCEYQLPTPDEKMEGKN